MTWVKLCGMTTLDDVAAAESAGADAVGFVIAPESSRRVTPSEAAVLADGCGPAVYLVTVDLPAADAMEAVRVAGAEGLQPNGRYAAEAAEAALAAGFAVLYPVRVSGPVDLGGVPAGAVPLLDTAVAGRHGGTGRRFDWSLARDLGRDVVVAGGLTPENVAEAVAVTGAWGVDVSSGVESAPGVKDAAAMRRFVEAVR